MTNPIAWLRAAASRRPLIFDAFLAGAMAAFALAGTDMNLRVLGRTDVAYGVGVALNLAMTLPLAVRRRTPLTVAVVVGGAFGVFRLLEFPEGFISSVALFLALYSAGAYGRPRWPRDVTRGGIVVLLLGLLVWALASEAEEVPFALVWLQLFSLALNLFFFGAAWVLGDLMRTRGERERLLEERTRELERQREENARRAVMEERVRIARELHDVVAHHVSVMGVQAAGARRVLRSRPEQAEEALAAVEASSRSAVGELQRLLGLLRRDDDESSRAPQPGLRDLGDLAAQMREAGLPVDVVIEGEPAPLPAATELSLFRVVQEALTNTLRHAGRAHASVVLRHHGDQVELEVRDDGRGSARPVPEAGPRQGGGNGIPGMRERVDLLGGTLEVGPNPGGGFRVHAVVPTGERTGAAARP